VPENSISISHLSRSFGAITAVGDVSMSIGDGEMFGIIGPDGAGKTTLIRMLCGILAPTSGTARILGHDLRRETDLMKKEIGSLSQRFSLYGDLSVDENIEFFAEINNVYDYHARRDELLEFTRLTPFRDRLAERLSGGMKQKLALACTLIHTPRIIFLDEPTTGVDPVSRRDFWKILQSLLKEGITIVMSTPYLDEAERCTRIALMNQGRIFTVDTPMRVKSMMEGEVVELVVERVRDAHALLLRQPYVHDVQAFGDRINAIITNAARDLPLLESVITAAGIPVTGRRIIRPSLENVFIYLLQRARAAGGTEVRV
jgi:ABC-2 type transport system ATP-binding protein